MGDLLRDLVTRGANGRGLLLNLRTGCIEKKPPRERPKNPSEASSLVAPEDVPCNEKASPSDSSGSRGAHPRSRITFQAAPLAGLDYEHGGRASNASNEGAGSHARKTVLGARAKAAPRNGATGGRAAKRKISAESSSSDSSDGASSSSTFSKFSRSSSSTGALPKKLPGPRNALGPKCAKVGQNMINTKEKPIDRSSSRKCGEDDKGRAKDDADVNGTIDTHNGNTKVPAGTSKNRVRKIARTMTLHTPADAPQLPRVLLAKMGETCCEVLLERIAGAQASIPLEGRWDMSQRTSVERCRLHITEVGGLGIDALEATVQPTAILWRVKVAQAKDAESLKELGKYLISKGRVGLVENPTAQIYLIPPHRPFQTPLGVDEPGSMLAVLVPRAIAST